VVEVLSDGTEDYDRSEKLDHYKQVASLRHCLLVSHRAPRVEVWSRDGSGGWACQSATTGESVTLQALGCELPVAEIYRGALLSSDASR